MENKIKAVLATILAFSACIGITYGVTKHVQFVGVMFISALTILLAISLYKSFYQYFESKNNKNK